MMKKINSIQEFSEDKNIITGIDIIGNFKYLFKSPVEMNGALLLLCTRGTSTVTIHLTSYKMKRNSIAIILPHQFFQITEQSNDCRFVYVGFSHKLLQTPALFNKTLEYIHSIYESPVVTLSENVASIIRDYFKLLIRATKLPDTFLKDEQLELVYTQLVMGLGTIYRQDAEKKRPKYNRNEEIVKELVRIIVDHYKTERNITFYAEKMHLSPQHLSTTIKKTTGKTLTDIISTFVIKDAQAKLRSTELTIQEIAYSLNFSDISFFGKYFKRYTGMSPKQYRNME